MGQTEFPFYYWTSSQMPETFFWGENTHFFLRKKREKDTRVWSNLKVQRPPKGNHSIANSMYCLRTTRPRPTGPKVAFKSAERMSYKESKTLHTHPPATQFVVAFNRWHNKRKSNCCMPIFNWFVITDCCCCGSQSGDDIVICLCFLSVKFPIEWELDRNRLFGG